MSQSIKEWWAIIERHYGTLEGFTDATTVRTMRKQCIAWIADDVATVVLLQGHPEEIAAWDAMQEVERGEVERVLKACSNWLKTGGSNPDADHLRNRLSGALPVLSNRLASGHHLKGKPPCN